MSKIANTIRLVLIVLTLTLSTSALAQQPNQPQPPPAAQKQLKKDGSEVQLCGAPTKAGGKCKRHVKTKGEVCWMHKGK